MMINEKHHLTRLMESKSFKKIYELSLDEVERVLNIPSQKRTKTDKEKLNYFKHLLSIAQKKKINYDIIKKMP